MEDELKLAIINGPNSNEDGEVERFYIGKEDYYHSKVLFDVVNSEYSQDELGKVDLKNANSMALFLRENGNIVFFNTTTYIDKQASKHGRTGILIMPDEITENQKDSLMEFNRELSDYDELQVWYEFTDDFNCQLLRTKTKDQVKTIVPDVLEKVAVKGKQK